MLSIMSDADRTISNEELVELQKKFSEIKHAINNALAVMMALSEMSQRRPDYSEKLASTVLTKAPQIGTPRSIIRRAISGLYRWRRPKNVLILFMSNIISRREISRKQARPLSSSRVSSSRASS